MKNIKNDGCALAPYILKTVKTSINSETVWHSNRWKNLLLKIKRFFYKSKNIKNAEKYLNKEVHINYTA
jgi:hypothetical protein